MEDEVNEDIRKSGWSALSISDADPPFPIMQLIAGGRIYRESGTYSGVLEGDLKIGIRAVHSSQHPLYLATRKLALVEPQLQWLREIGFEEVDCHWKWLELALFGGVK